MPFLNLVVCSLGMVAISMIILEAAGLAHMLTDVACSYGRSRGTNTMDISESSS